MTKRRAGRTLTTILLVLILLVGVAGAFWLINRPRPGSDWSGDPGVVTALHAPDGLHEASVVVVERGRTPRRAGLGADTNRPFELGSVSKTFLGLLLADAEARGELRPDDRLDRWVPELGGTAVADVTLAELATHTAGLPHEGKDSTIGLC